MKHFQCNKVEFYFFFLLFQFLLFVLYLLSSIFFLSIRFPQTFSTLSLFFFSLFLCSCLASKILKRCGLSVWNFSSSLISESGVQSVSNCIAFESLFFLSTLFIMYAFQLVP